MDAQPILKLEGASKHFPVTKGLIFESVVGYVRAVDEVSLELGAGEAMAPVGESDCGRSRRSTFPTSSAAASANASPVP